ncbi:hypothetical protein Hamer_G019332 [Homarus americanus]|uniref:Uncharacterized protein n=1 Tax=Homarus americanus TaxID=6706 RepID=A0A8J5JP57_HOMAM|nr:hypothetical protein Hamer_G019332 [Homarus americanus]
MSRQVAAASPQHDTRHRRSSCFTHPSVSTKPHPGLSRVCRGLRGSVKLCLLRVHKCLLKSASCVSNPRGRSLPHSTCISRVLAILGSLASHETR